MKSFKFVETHGKKIPASGSDLWGRTAAAHALNVKRFGEPSGKFGEVRGTFGEGPGRSKKASDPIQFYIRSIRLHLGQT